MLSILGVSDMSDVAICAICKKPVIRFEQTITRWLDENGNDCVAHYDCKFTTHPSHQSHPTGETGVINSEYEL